MALHEAGVPMRVCRKRTAESNGKRGISMIQIAICDGCEADLLRLKGMLTEIMEKHAICHRIHEYSSGEKLLEAKEVFHLVFLEIVMDGMNGMEAAKRLCWRNRFTKIIFQTNFGEYCKEAVNRTHAFAFLEKPLQAEEVEEQVREFLESNGGVQDIMVEIRNVRYMLDRKEKRKASLNLPVKDIIYFEHLKVQKEIRIVTETGEYRYTEMMSELEERMKPLGFETCCRGMLVNLERIEKIKRHEIFLDTGDTLPLSQRRVAQFKGRINEYMHGR